MSIVKKRKRGKYNRDEIYNFIYDNPDLNGMDISKGTGISKDHIYYLLNELEEDGRISKYQDVIPNIRYKNRVAKKFENKYFASESRIR